MAADHPLSEDIDLFVNPEKFKPRPGKNKLDRIVKQLAEAIAEHPALTWLTEQSRTTSGRGREDHFAYDARFDQLPSVRPVVRLEPGVQSGDFPTEVVPIASLVGQFLRERGLGDIAEDTAGFDMTLLHYRRTFVEKLFALHGKVVRLQEEQRPLGRDARHYPDLYALACQPKVTAMLASPEYSDIRLDYDEKSRLYFPKSHRPPAELSFASSPAIFPDDELRMTLASEYETQCAPLFATREYPQFELILKRFAQIRHML